MHWLLLLIAAASEPSSDETGDIFSILNEQEQVIVTVSRREQRLSESSLNVEVITAEDIRRSGVTFLPELLRRTAGLDVAQSTYSDFKVGIRGDVGRAYETDKVLLLVDGRPLMQEALGSVAWNQIPVPITMLERIEIVRGPGVTLFGGNALMGVVNLITKTAAQMNGVFADVAFGASTPNASRASIPYLRTRVNTRWLSEDSRHAVRTGIEITDTLTRNGGSLTLRLPQSTIYAGYEYSPSTTRHLRLHYFGHGAARDYVRSTADPLLWREQNGESNVALEYADDSIADGRGSLQLRGMYRINFQPEHAIGVDLAGNPLAAPIGHAQTGISEVLLDFAPAPDHKLTFGGDLRTTGVQWEAFGPGGGVGISASLFAGYSVRPVDRLTLDVAVRGSMFAYPQAAIRPFFLAMPRGGMALRLDSQQTLRASLGYSQRAPYLFDLFSVDLAPYSLLGNPALKPEGLLGADIGYARTSTRYDVSLAAFANVFDHLRERTSTDPVQAVNASNVWAVGGEAALGLRLLDYVRLRGNYSLALYFDRATHRPYAAGPRHKGNLTMDIDLPFGFELNAAGGLVGASSYVAQPAPTYPALVDTTLPFRWYGDLTIGWVSASGLSIQLAATNLARVGQKSLYEYPGTGVEPVATRVLVNVGYRSQLTASRELWHEKWWGALLWGAAGAAVCFLPLVVATAVR